MIWGPPFYESSILGIVDSWVGTPAGLCSYPYNVGLPSFKLVYKLHLTIYIFPINHRKPIVMCTFSWAKWLLMKSHTNPSLAVSQVVGVPQLSSSRHGWWLGYDLVTHGDLRIHHDSRTTQAGQLQCLALQWHERHGFRLGKSGLEKRKAPWRKLRWFELR